MSRATLYRYLADEAVLPSTGELPTCTPPAGGPTKLFSPDEGTTNLFTPDGESGLNPPRGQQYPLAPTCQWAKGDAIS